MHVSGTYTGFYPSKNASALLPVHQQYVDFARTKEMLSVNPFMNPTGNVWDIIINPEGHSRSLMMIFIPPSVMEGQNRPNHVLSCPDMFPYPLSFWC